MYCCIGIINVVFLYHYKDYNMLLYVNKTWMKKENVKEKQRVTDDVHNVYSAISKRDSFRFSG